MSLYLILAPLQSEIIKEPSVKKDTALQKEKAPKK